MTDQCKECCAPSHSAECGEILIIEAIDCDHTDRLEVSDFNNKPKKGKKGKYLKDWE